jgi:hypothetical protein
MDWGGLIKAPLSKARLFPEKNPQVWRALRQGNIALIHSAPTSCLAAAGKTRSGHCVLLPTWTAARGESGFLISKPETVNRKEAPKDWLGDAGLGN